MQNSTPLGEVAMARYKSGNELADEINLDRANIALWLALPFIQIRIDEICQKG